MPWSGSRAGAGVRVWRGVTAAGACGALLAAGLAAAPAAAAQAAHRAPRPRVSLGVASRGVGVLGWHPARVRRGNAVAAVRLGRSWPAAGSTVARLAAPGVSAGQQTTGQAPADAGGAASRASGLAVTAGRMPGSAGPPAVDVAVLAHRVAQAAGIGGVVFTARAAQGRGGLVRLGLNYSSFADVSGGDFGLGLGLEELPACALTTPQKAACRKSRPLTSVNDAATRTVSAVVSLPGPSAASAGHGPAQPAAARAGTVVLAAADTYTDGGGVAGTYDATSLKPSGTWSAGGSDGAFTYSYPMAVPPSPGDLEPQVGLSYDSGSVDGQTAQTQVQSSWVGDGWSTPQAYISQAFIPCQDKPEGSAAPDATQDVCYDGPVLTLSLNGSSTPLVCPVPFSYTTTSTCDAASDTGEVITHHVNSGDGQGTQFTDYWTVTTRDGTTYTFGRNRLPAWSSGDPQTDSVQWEPVFSAHSGDPCYQINGPSFAGSSCPMAYQWNLDYTTDVHGNAVAYFYDQSMNAYHEYGTTSAVSYVRDAYLDHIFYGFTDGNVYGHPADEVTFATGDRCFAGSSACDPLSSTTAPNWDDVPYVQHYCAAGSASCSVTAPSYWSTVALTSVSAKQWNGSAYVTVDSWALVQKWSQTSDGTSPTLWLKSVTRTGSDAYSPGTSGPSVGLPSVSFGVGTVLPNRLDPGTYPALDRDRISTITTETGSVIQVSYTQPVACSASSPPSPASNTSSCFPVYWGPFTPSGLGADWYISYAVQSVAQSDPAGGSPGLFDSYSYARPAWHYDDNEVVQPQYRTYGQWRGYGDVKTYTGSGADPVQETETTYYQGMSDDNNSTAVNLTDSQGGSHPDTDQLAGDVLESTTYAYKGGPVDDSQIYSYWVSPAAASRARPGLPALTANFTGQVEEWTRQAITGTSATTWRTTETDTSYQTDLSDPTAGLPVLSYAHGDLSQPSQAMCTQISYAAANQTLNLAGLVSEVQVDAAACGGSNPGGDSAPGSVINELAAPSGLDYSTQVISDTRTFYDDPSLAQTWPQPASPSWPQAAPGNSDASVVQQATGYSNGAFTYQTKSAAVYDSYGQATASYDGDGNRTATADTYTNGSMTQQTVTNPLGQATVTTYDPQRGLPVTVTDANQITTTFQYDELGRLTSVWAAGRATSQAANVTYSYDVPPSGPTVVTARQLNNEGGYVTSTSLYDSLLRLRQTQVPTPQGGILVTDDFYNSLGQEWKTNTNWWDTTCPTPSGPACPPPTPGSAILTIPDSQVPDQTVTDYDGMGRPAEVISYDDSAVRATSYTVYTGDKVIQIPPLGGTPTTTVTDALGRTTELDSWTAAPTVSASVNSDNVPVITLTGGSWQAVTDSYNTRGELSSITDATTGEAWTRSYNQLGEVTQAATPNTGTTSMTYDADGKMLTTTSALGQVMSWAYDALGRPVSETDTTNPSSPAPVNTWAYDNSNDAVAGMTDPVGQLTTATSYASGKAYTVQQTGFNAFGESTGENIILPVTSSLGALSGTTWAYTHTYTAISGQPLRDTYPASSASSPALPAETVSHGYSTAFDLPSGLGSNLAGYVQNVTYTAFSQIAQEEIGSATQNAYITNSFDPNTGALTATSVTNTAVSSTPYDTTSYAYDPSGNITAETDVRNGTQDETQCYDYDLLGRLTQAWTTDSSLASSCSPGPSAGSGGTVGDGIAGSAYWTSWAYNALGDQTSQDQHALTSGAAGTVTAYTYNDGTGTGSGQPDTLTSATTTGPGGTSQATYAYNADGDTTTRDLPAGSQSLTWNDNGTLASDTTSAGTTSYVYDSEGNVLVAEDPGLITLYLPGEQIYARGPAVTGTRFLSLPGGGQAVRTGPGTSYSFEITDQQGTSLLALDNTAANPVWRQETPYGAPRGTPPSSWPDTNGFLGAPTDSGTGLTIIGARQDDPGLGRFISPDPDFEAGDPQEYNGYTYAASDPVSNSDPTGLSAVWGGCDGSVQYCGHHPKAVTGGGNPGSGTPGSSPGSGGTASSPGTGPDGVPISQLIGGPHAAQIISDYTTSLLSLGHGYGPHIPDYIRWDALAQACEFHPGLCPATLTDSALHWSGQERYSYQLGEAAYFRHEPKDIGDFLAAMGVGLGATIVALAAPEILAAAADAAPDIALSDVLSQAKELLSPRNLLSQAKNLLRAAWDLKSDFLVGTKASTLALPISVAGVACSTIPNFALAVGCGVVLGGGYSAAWNAVAEQSISRGIAGGISNAGLGVIGLKLIRIPIPGWGKSWPPWGR